MKHLSKSGFFLGGMMVFAIVLVCVNYSLAENEKPETKVITLESQMAQLIDSQNKLTIALQEGLLPKNDFKNPDPAPQQSGGDGTHFPPPMICTQDYLEWPSSDTYKKADWAMEDQIRPVSSYVTQYTDLNGDGLTDYFYLRNWDGASVSERSTCVHLNNGRGWDLTYKCQAKNNYGTWTFYGDCAQQ